MPTLMEIHPVDLAPNSNKQTNRQTNKHLSFKYRLATRKPEKERENSGKRIILRCEVTKTPRLTSPESRKIPSASKMTPSTGP